MITANRKTQRLNESISAIAKQIIKVDVFLYYKPYLTIITSAKGNSTIGICILYDKQQIA